MNNPEHVFDDRTPGVEQHAPMVSYLSYTVGLGLAIIATIAGTSTRRPSVIRLGRLR